MLAFLSENQGLGFGTQCEISMFSLATVAKVPLHYIVYVYIWDGWNLQRPWEEGHLVSSEGKNLLHVTLLHTALEQVVRQGHWLVFSSDCLGEVSRVPGTLHKAVAILVTKIAILVKVCVSYGLWKQADTPFSTLILYWTISAALYWWPLCVPVFPCVRTSAS